MENLTGYDDIACEFTLCVLLAYLIESWLSPRFTCQFNVVYMCYGKCNKIGNYEYFPAVMYNFQSNWEVWWKTKVSSNFPVILHNIYVKWRIWISDRLFITIASKYVKWLLSLRECIKSPNSVSKCSNKWRKEIQIIVYMWTKILYKGINKSNFSLHQLVIKRKEKQNKRNVKHDDVKTNVIYFRTINYCDI